MLTATIIDHIYFKPGKNFKLNCSDSCFAGNITTDATDHLANFFILTFPPTVSSPTNQRPSIRIFSPANKELFKNDLPNYDWSSIVLSQSNVDQAYDNFTSVLSGSYEKCFPLTRISRKCFKDKQWVNKEVKKASELKNRLYKCWLISRSPVDKAKYKDNLKHFKKISHQAEVDYYSNHFNHKLNSTKKL